ncbi:MAG: heavy-metal-associated domain-containing protein, partial [Bacteroidota bacterium]|nr:heavy-metal-associated domain-containing protein [Bacteroidota bacterium]
MKSKFYISGMICSNCQKTVSDKIKAYEGVLDVKVSLETGLAEIDSKQYLEVFEISKLLGTKYTVKRNISRSKKETKLKLKQLTPLFLIFSYLIMGTFYISSQINANYEKSMQIFMGLFFITFSLFKFLDYRGFPTSFMRYDPLAKKIPFYANLYPFLETALGIAFLIGWNLPVILSITLLVLSITSIGV